MEQQSGIPVRSGIPRPSSRLPVLRPSSSQNQLRSVPSGEQLRKKPSLSSVSRLSQPSPSLQKKPSRSSLARSSIIAPANETSRRSSVISTAALVNASSKRASVLSNAPPANGTPKRASVLSTKRSTPSLSQNRASVADASVFKKPIGRPPSRQTSAPKPSNSTPTDDVLGDLAGFRSTASSRASSRTGFREKESEYVLENDGDSSDSVAEKPRLSLSQRTIESLSQLPSSPATGKGRRRSSFFNNDNPIMGPPLRPASALSNGRRPSTSDGASGPIPSTPRKGPLASQKGSLTTPGKRTVSGTTTSSSATPSRLSSVTRAPSTVKKNPLSQVQNVQTKPTARPLSNSKSMTARTPRTRPSLSGAFGQAASPTTSTPKATPSPARGIQGPKKTPETTRKTTNSSGALREQLAKAKAAKRSEAAASSGAPLAKPNSSQALREQIAKAREAAKRTNAPQPARTSTPPRDAIIPDPAEIASFDFGLDDPFNQRPKGGGSLLKRRVEGARADGRLNIAAMGLGEIPDEVLNMYQYDPDANTAWGEVVDLTSIIAADNELAILPDAMFPDIDYENAMDSEDTSPQFGGVQGLDLHGNMLRELPLGMRRLPLLSKLNLSRNKLSTDALDVVFQIATLRELKLAENEFEGAFPASLEKLVLLETLELQGNKLTSLPSEIRALTHLKTLNVFDNNLTGLPDELFSLTPIVDLNVAKNSIGGFFFNVEWVPHLQNLQLANNSITSLTSSGTVLLPSLQTLDLSANRLSDLPDVSSWTNLTTLLVGENKLSSLPEGFCFLQQLRNADFTSNDITKLEPGIALMEGLENLTLAANPLRERKFLTMGAEEIKRDLMSRLDPETLPAGEVPGDLDFPAREDAPVDDNGWKLTSSGTLDLSSQKVEIDEEAVASFAASHDVRQLYLQQNSLTSIPIVVTQLSLLSMLDLSKNNIVDPLTENLALPKLRELRLSGNKITSLRGITSMLSAPSLTHLDVSNNRIAGSLPILRDFFPELTTLLASDNSIDELSAESLEGLRVASLSNNDIVRLEPQIGRLAGTLTSFDVEGNKFRVPNYALLKKGTDAILAWLKDKIPSPTDEFFEPESPVPVFYDARG